MYPVQQVNSVKCGPVQPIAASLEHGVNYASETAGSVYYRLLTVRERLTGSGQEAKGAEIKPLLPLNQRPHETADVLSRCLSLINEIENIVFANN